ncbi:MAG: DUF6717 family protein [Verrucomicrobiota bacterium]
MLEELWKNSSRKIAVDAGLKLAKGFSMTDKGRTALEPFPHFIMTANSLFVLQPYRHQNAWVFDDAKVGLVAEPFVFGIDTMIDRMTAHIPNAEGGFRLIFSTSQFPGSAAELEWRREEAGGNWYYSPTFELEGWLCPALFKYFAEAPRSLFAKAEPLSR